MLFVHLFVSYAHVNLCHVFSSSWCRGLAVTSAYGSSWTFLFTFLNQNLPAFCSVQDKCHICEITIIPKSWVECPVRRLGSQCSLSNLAYLIPFDSLTLNNLIDIQNNDILLNFSCEQKSEVCKWVKLAKSVLKDMVKCVVIRCISGIFNKNEPRHDKTNKMSVRPAKLRSTWAFAQSHQSLHCALKE